jgi:hypothetical protein
MPCPDIKDFFTLEVSCMEERNKALERMAEARVTGFRVVDDMIGRDLMNLPGALKGASADERKRLIRSCVDAAA